MLAKIKNRTIVTTAVSLARSFAKIVTKKTTILVNAQNSQDKKLVFVLATFVLMTDTDKKT